MKNGPIEGLKANLRSVVVDKGVRKDFRLGRKLGDPENPKR